MSMRILAACTVLALAASACADPTSTDPGTIDHPGEADEPILIVTTGGGLVPAQYLFTAMPSFALYGDGALVVPGAQMELYPGPALPPMVARTISEAGIQSILRAALEAGLDRDGDYSDLGNMGIMDAGTTRFALTVDGVTHVVTAYALGMEGEQQAGQPDDVWEMRRSLARFQQELGSLATWLPADSLGQERSYEARAARLLIGPYAPDDELPQDPKRWPLPGGLGAFGEPADMLGEGWGCGVLEGDEWTAVHALAAESNRLTPWQSDGERYTITFRPLLPDESGCDVGTA